MQAWPSGSSNDAYRARDADQDELLGGSSGLKLRSRMASRATDKTTERCPPEPLGSVLRDRENQ
jgi:hypothetical protein